MHYEKYTSQLISSRQKDKDKDLVLFDLMSFRLTQTFQNYED